MTTRFLVAGLLALISGGAIAQSPTGVVPMDATDNPFSTANVDPIQPFGTVDVTMAGTGAESMRGWAETLDRELRTEISQRCQVISNHPSDYPADAVGFCVTWAVVTTDPTSLAPTQNPL